MPSEKNVSGYNKWSDFYDSYPNPTVAIDDLFFPSFYSEVKSQEVLEVGCGTGRHTARLIAQDNKVLGLDISEGMLEKAREKVKSPQVQFTQGDFLEISFSENSFDSLIMSLVLEHILDLDSFFKKAASVLKPKGVILLSEIHPERSKAGAIAHFKQEDGSDFELQSAAHTQEQIQSAAEKHQFKVAKVETICGTEKLGEINAKWKKHFEKPMIQIWRLQNGI